MMTKFNLDDPDGANTMRAMLGPHHVDQQIRQAISMCWMILPDPKRTPDAVATEIRRIVERALKDLAEDTKAFGA